MSINKKSGGKWSMKRLIFLLMVVLASCTKSPSSRITETPNKIPTHTATVKPTFQYTATPRYTPSPSKTRFVTPTPNPIDTPVGNDPAGKVEFLMETNGNCSYPCWWGITPGLTIWADAKTYLEPFSNHMDRGSVSNSWRGTEYSARFPNPLINVILFYADRDKIETIQIIQIITRENLQSILVKNGVPDEIWVNLQVLPPQPDATLLLFYKKGVMYRRTDDYFVDSEHNFVVCPGKNNSRFSELTLWNSDLMKAIKDFGKLGIMPMGPFEDEAEFKRSFKSLNEISNIQEQDFFDLYSLSSPKCIEIPSTAWYGSK